MEKKVRFLEKNLVQIKNLHVWTFSSREARKSVWMDIAKDRAHFKFKILHKFSKLLDPVMESKYIQFQYYCKEYDCKIKILKSNKNCKTIKIK